MWRLSQSWHRVETLRETPDKENASLPPTCAPQVRPPSSKYRYLAVWRK